MSAKDKYRWVSSRAGSFKTLALIYSLLLLIYTCLRLAFHLMHYEIASSLGQLAELYYWGFRLDFTAIYLVNIPFFFYYFFCPKPANHRLKARLSTAILIILNTPWIALHFIDLVYFSFHLRRSSIDLFYVFFDSVSVFASLFSAYWQYLMAFIFTFAVFTVAGFAIFMDREKLSKPSARRTTIVFIIFIAGAIISRGLSSRPILPSTPLLYLDKHYLPLASNSTLTMLYSAWKGRSSLNSRTDFTKTELDSIFSIVRSSSDQPLTKKNVVLFIMETIPKAYLDSSDPLKAHTPFLDSIISKSIVCKNAFANGLQSNEGIVALLAGIPPMTEGAYFQSQYNANQFVGIGTLLGKLNYSSSFFYGAERDHFGFEKFTRMLGIESYVSGDEYNHPGDHDKNWGIYDGHFFPFAAERIKQLKPPFFSVVYNLSTHYPYAIPASWQADLAVLGQTDAQNALSYYDNALSLFFNSIKRSAWYRETIFIFCADHAAGGLMGHRPFNEINAFQIPFFIHIPGSPDFKEILRPVQQLDVIPTAIDLLGYAGKFISFGKSVFDTTEGYVYNKFHGNLQLTNSEYLLGFNESQDKLTYLYNYKSDPALTKNLLGQPNYREVVSRLEIQLLAFLQRYNNSIIENKLTVDAQY